MPDIISHPVFIIFSVFFLLNILIYLLLFSRFAFMKIIPGNTDFLPPLSVIITAKKIKDDYQLLGIYTPAEILNQIQDDN